MMVRCHAVAVSAILVLGLVTPIGVNAQRVFIGGGLGVASVPRSLAPLCGSARRLNGGTASAQAGIYAGRLRVSASLDFTARGYHEVAECIPRVGTSVDSLFASANTSAITAAGDIWLLATRYLDVGLGAGWVPGHDAWFMSGGLGSQYRKVRVELAARRHYASFEEVTREFTDQGVRDISRSAHVESSWGGIVRLLLVTR
jgi:hypothetical protein